MTINANTTVDVIVKASIIKKGKTKLDDSANSANTHTKKRLSKMCKK